MVALEDLSETQVFTLAAIVRGGDDPRKPMACVEVGWLKDAGCPLAAIDELVALRVVVLWEQDKLGRPLTQRVTLTPFGAWLLGVHILERTTIVGEELEETPYWAELDREPAPLHLPKRRHEVRWPWMDELPDPDAVDPVHGPEFLVDEVSGKEIELFTQLFDGREVAGIKIKIDPKLKGAKGKGAKGKAKAQPKRRKAG